MLRARPGAFRLSDFREGGRPNLSWYNRFYAYQHIVYEDTDGYGQWLLPEGVRNAAGQLIVKADEVKAKNAERTATDWYLQSDAATPPTFDGAVAYVSQRVEQFQQIILEMERIVHSIGHGAIYVVDGEIRIMWGTNLAPEQEPGNPIPRGWFLFEPRYQRPPEDRSGLILDTPNRIWKRWYLDDGADQGVEESIYSGGIVGRPDYTRQLDRRPADYFAVFGTDEGFYRESLKASVEIARLDATIREACTTYGLPVPVVSTQVGLATESGLVDISGRRIQSGPVNALQTVEPGAPPLEYAQANPLISELMDEREQWIQRQHRINNVPRDVTENRDNQMSGVSRALLARPAIDRIEGAHRQIAKALNGAVEAITQGAGGLGEVQWPRQPFDTIAERRIIARTYFNDNIMTLNEARQYIDLEPVPGGDKFFYELAGAQQQQQSSQEDEPDADD